MLRSLRFGEADRILHLFTLDQGREGAIAKGARRTRSRFGGRLEPFSHVEIQLHQGRGELATVTGAHLLRSHHRIAGDPYTMAVGHIGLEAMLRLFIDHDPHPQAFHGLVRFLDLLDEPPAEGARREEPTSDPISLGFQLKLLWLAGYLPHLTSCAGCGSTGPVVAFSARAGGVVCASCAHEGLPIAPEAIAAARRLLERPLADSSTFDLPPPAARDVLRVIESLYEFHGGFRMRTLARR